MHFLSDVHRDNSVLFDPDDILGNSCSRISFSRLEVRRLHRRIDLSLKASPRAYMFLATFRKTLWAATKTSVKRVWLPKTNSGHSVAIAHKSLLAPHREHRLHVEHPLVLKIKGVT